MKPGAFCVHCHGTLASEQTVLERRSETVGLPKLDFVAKAFILGT